MPRYATILPLDFTDKREELSVVYVNTDWKEMVRLVNDPVSFLQTEGALWPQNVGDQDPHEWELLRPASVIFKWAGKDFEALSRTQTFLAPVALQYSKDNKHNLELLTSPDPNTDIGSIFSRLTADQGFFIAIFALKTHTLLVYYHPAPTPDDPRFHGKFTNMSLVQLANADGVAKPAASLHFDIGRSKSRRAHFILDFLEDCAACCERASKAGDGTILKGTANLFEEGKAIRIAPLAPVDPPAFETLIEHPTVIMETAPSPLLSPTGPSTPPDDCQICVEVNGVWQNPSNPDDPEDHGTFIVGTTIVKCYVNP